MTPNPASQPIGQPVRYAGPADDDGAALDDLGYECAMPHLWVGEHDLPDGPSDAPARGDRP